MSVNIMWDECVGFITYPKEDAPDVRLHIGNCLLTGTAWHNETVSLWWFICDMAHLKNIAKNGNLLAEMFDYIDYSDEKGVRIHPTAIYLNCKLFTSSEIYNITTLFAKHNLPLRWFYGDFITRDDYLERKKEISHE